jgi:acyl-CoA thioesterase I
MAIRHRFRGTAAAGHAVLLAGRALACGLAVVTGTAAAAGEPGLKQVRLEAPECIASRPALATSGTLVRTAQRLRSGGVLQVLAIGSSTTAGYGASSPAAAYPALLKKEIEARMPSVDVAITVSGVGGETASKTVARLEVEVGRVQPDLVIWQVGTNDALADIGEDDFRALVERGVAATTAIGADLVLLDQQFYPSIRRKDRYERFVAIVRDVGLKKRACVFGRYALMKAWGEQSDERLQAMLSKDGFHMSDRGHACMARILADEIVTAATKPDLSAGLNH